MDTAAAPAPQRTQHPLEQAALPGQEDHRRARTCCSSGCWWRCWRAATSSSRACRAWPRPWPSRRWRRRSAGSSSASSSPPTSCRPTSSGTRIYNQQEGEFQVSLGPVFANLLLADEINRAPAKVQSALLEVMQERQVTIGRETHPAPDPFLVMATQNPIESEGTYPLPEAQVDRFMLKVLVGYPSPSEEFVVVERMTGTAGRRRSRCSTPTQLLGVPAAGRRGLRRPGADRVRRPARQRHPRPGRGRACPTWPATSPSAPARGRRSTWSWPPRRWPSSAAGTTPCRRTSATSPSTCCATASCSPTRRWPTTSAPTTCSAGPGRHPACPTSRCASAPRAAELMDHAAPLTAERVLRRLEWQVVRRLDGRLQGDYRTLFRGAGIDFARPARVRARRRPAPHRLERHGADGHARSCAQYTEDRELTAWLLLDRSASMGFGPVDRQKDLVARRARASRLAQLLTRGGNRVGAILFDNEVRADHPAGPGPQPGAADRPPTCCSRARRRPGRPPTSRCCCGPPPALARRRSLVVVVSDFISAARLGAARWPCSRAATRSSRCRSSTRASSSCPTSAWSTSRTPRPASRSSSTPTTPASGAGCGRSREERQAELTAEAALGRAPSCTRVGTDEDLVRALVRISELRRGAAR